MSSLEPGESSGTSQEENNLLSFHKEDSLGFKAEVMINHDKLKRINKRNLSLSTDEVFSSNLWRNIKKSLSRKNEIIYCVSTQELSIDISNTSGQVYLPLLPKTEVRTRLNKLSADVRSKITTVHFGAIKILITAQFREGMDSPIKMALIDNRINSRRDCVLGADKGNLVYRKFMFSVYPKFGVSLSSQNFDQILSFIHEFGRPDLMNKGDKVFSVTYLTAYALTNSIHSVDYKKSSTIELDEVFQELGEIQQNPFCEITHETDWAIDIAKSKPRLTNGPSHRIRGNTLRIGEPPSSSKASPDNLLRQVSTKIDEFRKNLSTFDEGEGKEIIPSLREMSRKLNQLNVSKRLEHTNRSNNSLSNETPREVNYQNRPRRPSPRN